MGQVVFQHHKLLLRVVVVHYLVHCQLLGFLLCLHTHFHDLLLTASEHVHPVLLELLGVGLFEAPIHFFFEKLVLGSKEPLIELSLTEHREAQAAFGFLLCLAHGVAL